MEIQISEIYSYMALQVLNSDENPPNVISLSKDFFGGEKAYIDVEVGVLYQ